MEGFEKCQKKFIHLHAEPGSIIISWVFPKGLSGRLEQLAHDNAAIFKDNGVVEVTVGWRRVFPCTQQDMASSQGVSEKEEEKSKLKLLYIEFYHQLVEAVSDPDTCHSLTTQLHSTSQLSEEKKAVLSSSLASGSSFLKVLGVEENPYLVTVLMEKMSAVNELQTLSEDMSSWLSGSKEGAADTQFTGKQAHYERIERQQLMADIERLSSDKADLLTRLQRYEEDLKTANELMRMREKAISGMMKAAHRRDTNVEEREEMTSHLKKELDESRREGVERESMLTREIEDLKTKQLMQTDELNETTKNYSELSSQLVSAKQELEVLRREEVEKESQLTREIADLKSKLMSKTDELNGAIKSNSELSSQLKIATQEFEELRREGIERESLLTRKIENLKIKTDELNEANLVSKGNLELSSQLDSAIHKLEELRREGVQRQERESLGAEDKLMTMIDKLNVEFKNLKQIITEHLLKTQHKNPEDTIDMEDCQSELAVEIDQEKPKFSLDKEQPKELANSKEDYEAAKVFALEVKIVIQSCNNAEYYAALDMLEPPKNFDKPVKFSHTELLIVVGTFASIEAAIVKTSQGEECKEELKTVFEIFTSAKLLLGLGICFGLRDNPAKKDLKFADVLVASEIGASKRPKAESDGMNPREKFIEVKRLVCNIFCSDAICKWNGIAVCEVPAQRISKVYVGRLFSASILMNDPHRLQKIKDPLRNYLGGEMEGWAQFDIPNVQSIIIKGIADFADGKKMTNGS